LVADNDVRFDAEYDLLVTGVGGAGLTIVRFSSDTGTSRQCI